jgi:hypothetical protein
MGRDMLVEGTPPGGIHCSTADPGTKSIPAPSAMAGRAALARRRVEYRPSARTDAGGGQASGQ